MNTTLATPHLAQRNSWLPMIGLFLAQVLMSFNVSALPVSIGGMVDDFGVAPTAISTAIVMYGLAVAALVMLGSKLGQRVGWLLIFRIVVVVFACSGLLMMSAPSVQFVLAAQILAGAAAAIIVPALVALIAENYHGNQQATAIGSLGSARALAGMSAFLLGGLLGSTVGWRPVFGVVVVLAVAVFAFSFTLRSDRGNSSVEIDVVAAMFIGVAVVLLTLGFNNLNGWGIVMAREGAPFDVLGLSPAPIFIVLGLILGQAFVMWTRRRVRDGKAPLVSLSVLGTSRERAALYAMIVVVALEAALNFTVPLYIQIVQGRSPLSTSLAMMPFNLTVFITATLIVRFYKKYTPRTIGMFSFGLTTIALIWLAFVVNNDWETVPTIAGLIVFGIGQGALVTLVFNVLVTAAPKELAGDVGSIRGTAQNLASAVGTAVAGAMLVTILGFNVAQAVAGNVAVPDSVVAEIDLDNVNFVSNDGLREALSGTDATEAEIDAVVQVNTDARLNALKTGLLILAAVSAMAILPASRLPGYKPEEIPDPCPETAGSPSS